MADSDSEARVYRKPKELSPEKAEEWDRLVMELSVAFFNLSTFCYLHMIEEIDGYPFNLSLDEYDGRVRDMLVKGD